MKKLIPILAFILLPLAALAQAQPDRKEVRSGNRDFKKKNFKEAEIDYRRAIVKDSLSVAGNYNLANTLYKMGEYQDAAKYIEKAENAGANSDVYFNKGDIALQNQDYNTAVDAFKQSLLLNPGDLNAKENYIYAKKKLQEQQNNQNQNQNQNQNNNNQNQDQDQNQDNNNQDRNKDQNQNKDNQDQNQDQNQDKDQPQNQQPQDQQLTPQAADQMLQAIEAKEKETQDKVKKEEALRMKSRQKEKNW